MADDAVNSDFRMDMEMENADPVTTHLLDLPPEVIRAILSLPILGGKDVCSVAMTCRKLNALVTDDCNDVWRAKHKHRWPSVHKELRKTCTEIDWLAECKRALGIMEETIGIINKIWPRVYMESEVCYSHFAPFRKMIEDDIAAYHYIKNFLMGVIHDGKSGINMTDIYQAKKVLRYVRQEYLTVELKKFRALPQELQLLEVGAAYISQWSQPFCEISMERLGQQLDKLAGLVLEYLAGNCSDHPIFLVPAEERKKWGTESILSDRWTASQCMQILRAMDHVLIECLGFCGAKENYHYRENYFIESVLFSRKGVPITLNVIVESVARRLGIHVEPWYRGHFVLRWKSDKNSDLGHVYLDAFNSGSLIRPETYMEKPAGTGCPYRERSYQSGPVTCIQVVENLSAGVEVTGQMSMRSNGHSTYLRSALELMFVVNPSNLRYVLHLARLYMLHNVSVSDLIESVMSTMDQLPSDMHKHAENILQMFKVYCPDAENKPLPAPHTRADAPNVQYAVGMSMFHKQYHYLCVIIGWDAKCSATDSWKFEMGVQWLQYKDSQPFYHVLVADGTARYAAQENLAPLQAGYSLNVFNIHPDVGRYFTSYQNGYYKPNDLKSSEYPDDNEFCRQYYEAKSK